MILRLKKLGYSLAYPACWNALAVGVAPAVEHRAVLRSLAVDGIIDVGANRGQFTLACQLSMPDIPVVAFEPIPVEAATFRKVHHRRGHVCLIESALGEARGSAVLHLSQSADSSSLLPIGRKQNELFENTREIGTLDVPINRLDDYVSSWLGRNRQLLKLDVQGFELKVLRGALETLRSCTWVYVECSEVALYDGQALRPEVEAFLGEHGFMIQGRYNEQVSNGQLIQADYLFSRVVTASVRCEG